MGLTVILLTWKKWRAPNNTRRWQMGFNLGFEGLSGQRYAPGMNRYPLYRKVSGSQAGSGQLRKFLTPTGIRYPDRRVRSDFLYRLSCPTFKASVHILDRQNDNSCVFSNDAEPHWADANCDDYDDARAKAEAVNSPWHCARCSRFSPRSVCVGFVVGQRSTERAILPTLNTY